MKKALLLVFASILIFAGCNSSSEKESAKTKESEKQTEMTSTEVELYLTQMTNKYSLAFTASVTQEDKMNYLNEAITEINETVEEIQNKYENGTSPADELLELADILLDTIDYELRGNVEKAQDSAYESGVIIGDISREYLEGELPVGIQMMTGIENANE